MKNTIKLSFIVLLLFTTGCFKRDSLEGITVYTTAYPIEYITDRLYSDNATIFSIYPNETNIYDYELNEKQISDYSKSQLFIFNGLGNERDYVIPMFLKNDNLKIIDASATIDIDDMDELWMDPTNFLKMLRNIKNGFDDYVTNQYLKSEINEEYDKLRIEISAIDANIRHISRSADDRNIIVDSAGFEFLSKYEFLVTSLTSDDVTDKTMAVAKDLIESETVKYIFVKDSDNINDSVRYFVENYEIELIELHTLANLSETERGNDFDYIYLMNENIQKIKSEVFD